MIWSFFDTHLRIHLWTLWCDIARFRFGTVVARWWRRRRSWCPYACGWKPRSRTLSACHWFDERSMKKEEAKCEVVSSLLFASTTTTKCFHRGNIIICWFFYTEYYMKVCGNDCKLLLMTVVMNSTFDHSCVYSTDHPYRVSLKDDGPTGQTTGQRGSDPSAYRVTNHYNRVL